MNHRQPNTPLTEYQRSVIRFLHASGRSAKEITAEEDLRRANGDLISIKVVKYWTKRFDSTGDVKTKPRSGRPKVLSARKESSLINYIHSHNKMVYNEVRRKKRLWKVTRRTINNYALRNKIRSFRAVKKPPLSGPNRLERVAFAERLLKDEQLMDELIFSDEKLFKGGPSN